MTETEELQKIIDEHSRIVFFGGAGVSTESGIPDFRSVDGLYNQKYDYPPEKILSHTFFMRNTEEFYRFYREKMLITNAEPNAAHLKLAELETKGRLMAVVTQNIDGLHQKAGSKNVYELHGSVLRNYCMKCGRFYSAEDLMKTEGVPYCDCGGVIKPDVVFSKGGFVSVPVVLAAKSRKIPCVIHESDMTPGLANKICIPCANRVCTNFPETIKHLPPQKAVLTGSPIREELFHGDKEKGLAFCGFTDEKPTLLIIGGSLGAVAVNTAVRSILPKLLEKFQIIHLCGKGKLDESLNGTKGYVQYEYIKEELCDLMAAADVMISRAGANAICEILALRKPNILIPLSAQASRGDQILNAASFEKAGYSIVIQEEDVTDQKLYDAVLQAYEHRDEYVKAMKRSQLNNSIEKIVGLINEAANKK